MSSDPFVGEIIMFGGNFAPRGWALCDGQLLAINQNSALFSILGTTYGGDGRTTFALPDLRGRAPIHQGRGPGLSNIRLGQKGGTETTTLSVNNLPNHNHPATLRAGSSTDLDDDVDGRVLAYQGGRGSDNAPDIYTDAPADEALAPGAVTVGNTGGSQAFNNRPPFLAVNYIIALQGIFPSRN